MGISYDPTKPAANDPPRNDQGPMQTNFASIKTLIDVDHVDFANGQYGQHKQVTFEGNNPPSPPPPGVPVTVTPPILFVNNQDGAGNNLPKPLSQLFFYTGADTEAQNQYISQPTGSVLILGGIILKWGTITGTNAGNPITFTPAFPNNCFSLVLTSQEPAISSSPAVTTVTKSGFIAFRSSGGNQTLYYIAIGN